jgi:peptide/nickel transport system substrate-binding protein
MLNYPPAERPRVVEFTQRYVEDLRRLGVPIRQEIVGVGSMSERAFLEAEFDVHPMEWSGLSTRGADSLYRLFHSDNAHGEDSAFDAFAYNASGYGLEGLAGADEEIDAIRREPNDGRRNALVQRLAERLYLEAPTLVRDYPLLGWPVNTGEYAGFTADVPSPGGNGLWKQCLSVHRR